MHAIIRDGIVKLPPDWCAQFHGEVSVAGELLTEAWGKDPERGYLDTLENGDSYGERRIPPGADALQQVKEEIAAANAFLRDGQNGEQIDLFTPY